MTCSTCHPLHACGLKRGRGTLFGLISGVFEPDFDKTDMSLRWVVGTLKLTLYTEAGILVFDMAHGWVNIDMDTHKGQSLP